MLFWHNHFVSAYKDNLGMGYLGLQHQTMRANAVGDFHALAQSVCVDPGMLVYLDNSLNVVGRAQENFGRELMELFTLGVGNYTQTDVTTMAKAWTGYTLDPKTAYRTSTYNAAWHDSSTQPLFGSSAQWSGPAALTEILKGSKAEASSRFITAKLFSHFAYPVTEADAVVASLATVFRDSGLDILGLLRAIFRSPEFWSTTARGALVRSPIEWMVASMQALNLTTTSAVPQAWMARIGQTPWGQPDVSGWKDNDYWISTSRAWARSGFARSTRSVVQTAGTLDSLQALTPADAVTAAFTRFGISDPSPVTRAALEAMCARAKKEGHPWSIGPNMTLLVMLCPDFLLA
jgi:uncharacterized protein (DUF1800 family)